MASILYSITNNDIHTATINRLTIVDDVAIQHHIDFTGWDGSWGSETNYIGSDTVTTVTTQYVADYPPNLLVVDANTGINSGYVASGTGYSAGQYVISSSGTNWLVMSAAPNGTPTPGGTINFISTVTDTLLTIPPLSTGTVTIDYTNNVSTLGTYTSIITVYGTTLLAPFTKNINNFAIISLLPVPEPESPFYDPIPPAGGGDGASPGDCGADGDGGACGGLGDGGAGECFTANTLIKMYDNTTKPISKIVIGDLVVDALTGKPNKVIGIKATEYEVGRRLFATEKGITPFITEQHAFYDDHDNLCAMSEECEYLAPWLGTIKIVDVPEIVTNTEIQTVYNLMLETGNSHYANGIRVSNMVGTGNTYVLLMKGYLDNESYLGYIYHLENTTGLNSLTQEQKTKIFNIVARLSNYVLNNNNLRSRLLAKSMSWAIRNRTTLYPYLEKWLKSKLRNFIIGKKNEN